LPAPEPSSARDATAWVRARAALWQSFAAEVRQAPQRSQASVADALHTLETYRTLARDLASARELLPGSPTTAALEGAVSQLHVAVGRPPRYGRARWQVLFGEQVPAAARSVLVKALWIALLLLAFVFAGWWLITTYPELIGVIANEEMISGVEQGHLWTEHIFDVVPPSLESARIFSGNIMVTVFAFSSGLLFGLGTFYIIALNGLLIGALLAFTHQHGLMLGLLKFMMAHGPVELSVICMAGAAGATLGESLIRPSLPTRAQSFRACVEQLAPLVLTFVPLLVGAGLIEGYISPVASYSIPFRLVVGWSYWLLMLLFLSGRWMPSPRGVPHE
jgi:uncharacterized membrane protein SpoIIM required for sporulation